MTALILPFPNLTGDQVELICRRYGLALAHLGQARFCLVQTARPMTTMLRMARPEPESEMA